MTDTYTPTPDHTREMPPQPAARGGGAPDGVAWGPIPPQGGTAWGPTPPRADPWQPPQPRLPRRRADWRDWGRVGVASLASASLAAAATFALVADDAERATSPTSSAVVDSAARTGVTDFASVADAVRDSVVAITVVTPAGQGAGSGVIIDTEGNVLTNNHVIAGARSITVTLADGRILTAEPVGTDESTDLAVVRLVDAPGDLVPAELGTSADLEVGQQVMAVGNPLGLSSTVTTGIISALDRPVTTAESTQGFQGQASAVVVTNAIQVDAAINPGNSGGPVFDMSGRVIGIASSIATLSSGSSGSIGLGFAIPVDLASRVAGELIESGTASHAFLGVSMSDTEASVDGTTRAGALVREVVDGSAASAAGLEVGDVVVAIGGRPVSGSESLTGYVRQYTPGTRVDLEVARGGTAETVTVTLGTSR